MKCPKCSTMMEPSCIDDQGGDQIYVTEWKCPNCGKRELGKCYSQ